MVTLVNEKMPSYYNYLSKPGKSEGYRAIDHKSGDDLSSLCPRVTDDNC